MTPTGKHELVPSHGGGVPNIIKEARDCQGNFLEKGNEEAGDSRQRLGGAGTPAGRLKMV